MNNRSALKNTMAVAIVTLLVTSACATPVQPVREETIEPGTEFGNQLGAVEYVIKEGDNLVLIASEQTRASENWRRIADFNRIENPASIKVGQKIWIPKDLIPLSNTTNSREVAGHPDAIVNSVTLPKQIKPKSN